MKNISLVIAFLFSLVTYSQSLDYNNSYESINVCTAIQGNNFASERAADSALDDILNVIGASKRFVLQECSNINNAVALTMNGVRYIMYDPEFMTSLSYGDEWSNKFILAHEVGHHINGHTVDVLAANSSNKVSLSTRRIQELESDEFAGFVLGRLGASLSDALSGVQSLSDKDDSYSTHPRRSRRIAAIKKGFKESGGYVNPSNLDIRKGKVVDSKYSNSSYSGVKYVVLPLGEYYSDAVYKGYISESTGNPFGYGTLYLQSGSKYEGEMAGGKRNGYGTYTYADGTINEGFWVDNKFTGQGIKKWANGAKDIGYFVSSKLTGNGKQIFSNGDIIEGDFINGDIISVKVTFKSDGNVVEFGFLDGSKGQGMATFTDYKGNTYKGKFKDAQVDAEPLLRDRADGRKKYRRVGLTRFIPTIVLESLNINSEGNSWEPIKESVGYLIEKNEYGYKKAYYNKSFFWSPTRAGYCEQFIDVKYEWNTARDGKQFDKFIGIYWDGARNGYGVKYFKGKIIEKGIYQDGKFVKSEDFDLELMQKTFKKWY